MQGILAAIDRTEVQKAFGSTGSSDVIGSPRRKANIILNSK
jgi:hypothetical protein